MEKMNRFIVGIAQQPNFGISTDQFVEIGQQRQLCVVTHMTFAIPMDTPDQRERAFLIGKTDAQHPKVEAHFGTVDNQAQRSPLELLDQHLGERFQRRTSTCGLFRKRFRRAPRAPAKLGNFPSTPGH